MRSGTHHAGRLSVFLLVCLLGILCVVASAGADTLVLPAGLTVIEEYAFYGDTSITSVVLPDGLEEIGAYAFAGCTNLRDVRLPDHLTELDLSAFEGNPNVYFVVRGNTPVYNMILSKGLPAEVDFEEGYAMIFDNNDEGFHCLMNVYMNEDCNVTEIFVPDCVEYIAPNAFANCSKLVSIALPNSIYGIGANAFDGCAAKPGYS